MKKLFVLLLSYYFMGGAFSVYAQQEGDPVYYEDLSNRFNRGTYVREGDAGFSFGPWPAGTWAYILPDGANEPIKMIKPVIFYIGKLIPINNSGKHPLEIGETLLNAIGTPNTLIGGSADTITEGNHYLTGSFRLMLEKRDGTFQYAYMDKLTRPEGCYQYFCVGDKVIRHNTSGALTILTPKKIIGVNNFWTYAILTESLLDNKIKLETSSTLGTLFHAETCMKHPQSKKDICVGDNVRLLAKGRWEVIGMTTNKVLLRSLKDPEKTRIEYLKNIIE